MGSDEMRVTQTWSEVQREIENAVVSELTNYDEIVGPSPSKSEYEWAEGIARRAAQTAMNNFDGEFAKQQPQPYGIHLDEENARDKSSITPKSSEFETKTGSMGTDCAACGTRIPPNSSHRCTGPQAPQESSETVCVELDRERTTALISALREAYPYVNNVASGERENWRGETASGVLARMKEALAFSGSETRGAEHLDCETCGDKGSVPFAGITPDTLQFKPCPDCAALSGGAE